MINREATHATLKLDGATLAYRDAGPREAPVVLLVHGFPLTGRMWRAQQAALEPSWRVLTPDLRGYGGSTLGDWPTDSPSLTRYADDLAAILAASGIETPVTLVGFSMGGYIALEMLRRHRAQIAALVMMDTRVVADDEDARAGRIKMAEHAAEWGSHRIAGMMRPKLLATSAPEAAVRETLAQIEQADPAAIAASQRAMAARPDSTALVASLDLPLLAIAGAQDTISPPEEMRAFARSAPRGEFHEIADAGHMAPIENPAAVSAVLAGWLDTLRQERS
ncbi:alpha/beta fold hydrolase [Botrimarina hoheduenensis]|uniref:alpha/beta fold hydrolase n=1 Tax=Botrimarina hoheduenensis TaxID=2528000 RepID=UPI0011B799B5|nr:alpha/beta hydrolase [Botrimarina hoheduenensis]